MEQLKADDTGDYERGDHGERANEFLEHLRCDSLWVRGEG
jgi:hypothetical protein